MAPLSRLLFPALLVTGANAHFNVKYPEPIGFEDDSQGAGPCGGLDPDFSTNTVSDFHVGGDSIALLNGHAQVTWIFRATLDQTASGNWTQIFPIVQQSGYNMFCEPEVTVPEEFVGKKGIIGIVSNAPDGLLYACAAVSFVEGAGESQDVCTNSTDVTISFTGDDSLSAMVGEGTTTSDDDDTADPTSTASGSEETGTDDSSARSLRPTIFGVLSAVLMGAAFVV
ncbi:uncharacterized protein MKZ38_003799 [Zalerion maritima]|uniref:Copper acquisition factor BIM1-like domain-containing protein n=1 Tax=Zalerion maritima TaxID=339359 RepID=A0AAD5RMD7_9PEZI|nr:uncharacterized protein MKZ38_003799 [Zalerion maritima]